MLAKPTLLCAIVAAACAASGIASAQTFPSKPIRIVVGFAPAGPADVMARLIGQRLTSIVGQSIVIDNRPGAGGTIGARAVAESDPDGYTLLLGNTSTLVISPLIYKNVNYDPVKGFAPVAALGTTSNLLIVNPALPVKSVQELITLARANPGSLNYASAGIGTPPHLIGEMFKQRLNLDVVHVPYKGFALLHTLPNPSIGFGQVLEAAQKVSILFQGVAGVSTPSPGHLQDTEDRPWPAAPVPARSKTAPAGSS